MRQEIFFDSYEEAKRFAAEIIKALYVCEVFVGKKEPPGMVYNILRNEFGICKKIWN